MKTRKIWIGIGAAISTAAISTPPLATSAHAGGDAASRGQQVAQAAPATTDPAVPKAGAGSGGEGGEGGENAALQAITLRAAKYDAALATRLVGMLRDGGYVLYFRHFETGEDTPDYINATLGQCATQRQLNEKGAAQAVVVRNAFQQLRVPVSRVYSSPFCRAWQSADLAFGGHQTVENLKLPKAKSKEFSEADKTQMRRALLPLLSAIPKAQTNTVIVAHDDNLPTVGAPYPDTQGEALIFKPSGKGFRLVMVVKPDVWAKLAGG